MNAAFKLDWDSASRLVALLIDFYQMKQSGDEIDFFPAAAKVAEAFGVTDFDAFLKGPIQDGLAGVLDEQSAEEIATIIEGMCKPIAHLVAEYAKGNTDPARLLENLNQVYLNNANSLTSALQCSLGFELPEGIVDILEKYSLDAVAVYCFAATCKIYRQAAADARLARSQRIEMERLCDESIMQLRKHRAEVEALFETYMLDRLEPFNASVAAMDKAIIEDDVDGFVIAHEELWQLLGRDGQYRNAREFDDLMFSNVAFRL